MTLQRKVLDQIQTTFISGLAVIIPLAVTYWFLNAFLNAVDGILSPVLVQWLGKEIPGLGFISMLLIIFLVGLLGRNFVGRILFSWFEKFLRSIPVVRAVYGAIKDLVNALSVGSKGRTFQQVVMVQYPRIGLYCIGFATNESTFRDHDGVITEFISVYFPHPPNPTSGVLILVPKQESIPLDMTIEQGLKLVLSGGIVSPGMLQRTHVVD
jgi:uncharacterized membrane protein